MKINIPTAITFFRLLLSPIFILICYSNINHAEAIAATIFAIASISDAIDGFLARKLNQSTKFGAFLDPLADKIIVNAALIILAEKYGSWHISLPAILLISREIIIAAIREWMAKINKDNIVSVSQAGKIKTLLQMVSLTVLIANVNQTYYIIGLFSLYASVVFSIFSIYQYTEAAIKSIKKN